MLFIRPPRGFGPAHQKKNAARCTSWRSQMTLKRIGSVAGSHRWETYESETAMASKRLIASGVPI